MNDLITEEMMGKAAHDSNMAQREIVKKADLLEEIKDLITEGEFNSRWVLIETYHKVGQMIIENNLVPKDVSDYIGRSERLVQHMVKFARTFKDVNLLPEGKNISMNKIIEKYLTTPQEKAEHVHDFKVRCWCGMVQ